MKLWHLVATIFLRAAGLAAPGGAYATELTPTDMASPAIRIESRTFPSVFEAWNPAQNLNRGPGGSTTPLSAIEDLDATTARHDLYFDLSSRLGLKSASESHRGLATSFTQESIAAAGHRRAVLLKDNPKIIILAPVNYYSAPWGYFPADSPWWLRDNRGNLVLTYAKTHAYRVDFSNPGLQDAVAALCRALIQTGVYDGCMLDWWHDDVDTESRVALIRKVRAAIGDQAILLGNVNGRVPRVTARYLNGMYMEGFGAKFFPDWRQAASNLLWAQDHLQRPVITALEGWWSKGRNQYAAMREVTTLSLVFSNGYVLFSDPNGMATPDHLHDWYTFWDKSLGTPLLPPLAVQRPNFSGAYRRPYQQGDVFFNPPDNSTVVVHFPDAVRSMASNSVGREFSVAPGDGDLFVRMDASR